MEAWTRRIDDLGRIVLPVEIRAVLNMESGDCVDIICDGKQVSLKKNTRIVTCDACKEETIQMSHIGSIKLCDKCIAQIKNG